MATEAPMEVIRIPRSWKQSILKIRESLPENSGATVIAGLAELAERSPMALASLVKNTVATTTAPEFSIQGQPIPSGLAPMVAEICELFRYNPMAARGILMNAIASHVESHPEPPPTPVGQVKFCLVNEYLSSDFFTLRGRSIKIPVGRELTWALADVAELRSQLKSRPYNHGRNAGYYTELKLLE